MRIRDWAFNGCTGLTHVTIPSSAKDIGESVFSGCYRLTSVESPSGTLKSFYGTPWYESEMHKRPKRRLVVIVIVSIIALVVALLALRKAIADEKPSYYR